jgi:RsiW-degrading membrane proteinase PrsW (M82 family)
MDPLQAWVMALEESLQYLKELPAGSIFLPPAELVRVSGHLVMGGISGFGLGAAALRWPRWPVLLAGCFVAATFLHFGWDWIVLSSPGPDVEVKQALRGSALMVAGLLVYGVLTMVASNRSHALFAPTSPPKLWGWPFTRREGNTGTDGTDL